MDPPLSATPVNRLVLQALAHVPYTNSPLSTQYDPSQLAPVGSSPTPSRAGTPNGRDRLVWSDNMREALLGCLFEKSVAGGLRGEQGFKQVVWQEVMSRVQAACGSAHVVTVTQCRSKYDGLKKDFRSWKKLQERSGWSYTEELVPLEPKKEIDDFVTKHKDCRKFRYNPLEHREWQMELFNESIATGADAVLPPRFGSEVTPSLSEVMRSIEPSQPLAGTPTPGPSSSAGSSEKSYISKRQQEVESASADERQLKRKRDKVNVALSAQLIGLNANVSALVKAIGDPQEIAIDLFSREFSAVQFRLREKFLDVFENSFWAKRFVGCSSYRDRILWVRENLVRAIDDAADRDEIREVLEELEAPFLAAERGEGERGEDCEGEVEQ